MNKVEDQPNEYVVGWIDKWLSLEEKLAKPVEFNEDTIPELLELGEVLRRIYDRLAAEGYRYRDGIIVPPDQGV